jgi:hypothetical protein
LKILVESDNLQTVSDENTTIEIISWSLTVEDLTEREFMIDLGLLSILI